MTTLQCIAASKHKNQSGFTIIELMIATLVFSVILVVITVGVLYFTKSYYHGVYQSSTQNAARSITESVMDSVRFGSGVPVVKGSNNFFCAGGYVFVFQPGEMYDKNVASTKGMYMQPMSATCALDPPSAESKQLLGNRMRIAYIDFTYDSTNDIYTLEVKVAYGADDFLQGTGKDMSCIPGKGSEYCAVATYSSSARQRI